MKAEYIRENNGSYLKITDENLLDSFEMKMIRNNEIQGFLPISVKQLNNQYIYMYNITGKSSLAEMYGRCRMNFEELVTLTEGLKRTILKLKEYLLNDTGLRFEPEYIFYEENQKKWYFIYFYNANETIANETIANERDAGMQKQQSETGSENGIWDGIKKLFEYIIGIIDHNDNEVVTYGYGIYKRICTERTTIEELFEYERRPAEKNYQVITDHYEEKNIIPEVRTEERETVDKNKLYMCFGSFALMGITELVFMFFLLMENYRPEPISKAVCGLICVVVGIGAYIFYKWFIKNKTTFIKIETKLVEMPYTKDCVRISIPEPRQENLTVVLGTDNTKYPVLEWREAGVMKKYIVENNIIIGSSMDKSDLVINENGISRTHAKICIEDGIYYIKDLNSTNGTEVNNQKLNSYQMMPVNRNDTIKLGNLELLFH